MNPDCCLLYDVLSQAYHKTEGILFFTVPFIVGMALGILNYAGLWCTAQGLSVIKRPVLLIMGSFVIRMGVTLSVFYLVMGGRWEKLVACTVGFFLVRHVMIRRLRPKNKYETI